MPVDRFWSSGRYAVAKPDTRHHSDGGVRTSGLKTLGLANRLFGQEVCDPRPWNSGGSARLLDGDHPYPARPKGVTAFRCCGQFPGVGEDGSGPEWSPVIRRHRQESLGTRASASNAPRSGTSRVGLYRPLLAERQWRIVAVERPQSAIGRPPTPHSRAHPRKDIGASKLDVPKSTFIPCRRHPLALPDPRRRTRVRGRTAHLPRIDVTTHPTPPACFRRASSHPLP